MKVTDGMERDAYAYLRTLAPFTRWSLPAPGDCTFGLLIGASHHAEYIDDDVFTQFDASPTTVVFGGAATSTATITGASTITLPKLDQLVAKAQKASPKVWPVRLEGGDFYVLVMHSDVAYDLRQTTAQGGWQLFQQQAGPREYDNNLIFQAWRP